jgi:hypothetical protein
MTSCFLTVFTATGPAATCYRFRGKGSSDLSMVTFVTKTKSPASFKTDIIFHLAGQLAITNSISNSRIGFEVNVIGKNNLLDVARWHPALVHVLVATVCNLRPRMDRLILPKVHGGKKWLDQRILHHLGYRQTSESCPACLRYKAVIHGGF